MWRIVGMVVIGMGVGLWPVWSSAAPAGSAARGEDPRATCERYAREDGVKSQHLSHYMQQCLRDLALDRAYEEEDAESEVVEEPTSAPPSTPPANTSAPEGKKNVLPTQPGRPR
ncbi:MAG: hypothetical protein G8237_04960 [Magnetococcales bacterium]|nr:hypothetical protein [Magnetococcales bacterium]NGZ05686.1 hypothetical protein [Magnetococcales bacterium]